VRTGRVVAEQPRVRLSAILERYDFQTLRREEAGGRPALVFAFAPRPGKRDLDGDNVMRRLTGLLWVDERDRQVVRAELRNVGPIRFAGGLGVRISRLETTIAFQKVDGQVWFPATQETVATGRVLLFKRLRTRFRQEYHRFRRFEVTIEEAPAGPPTQERPLSRP
jgi:hypothetical protein